MSDSMPIDIIIGGQGGDEGKGKIAAYLARQYDYDICARVPAPQAGHSIYHDGKRLGLALIPCGFQNARSRILIGAGGLIEVEKLLNEISQTSLTPERFGLDCNATVVQPMHKKEEEESQRLRDKIGSVCTGVGPCRRDKLMRTENVLFAKDIKELEAYLADTTKEMLDVLYKNGTILLEGDHGAKLDLTHSGEFPYVTSRSVNAATILGEANLGPREVRDIYLVLKPYVTRVAPGPLEKEIFDENALDWAHSTGGETGTVSKRSRRLGNFEWDNVRRVIQANSVTKIAITHMDCFDMFSHIPDFPSEKHFMSKLYGEILTKQPYPKLALLSYGPKTEDIVAGSNYGVIF